MPVFGQAAHSRRTPQARLRQGGLTLAHLQRPANPVSLYATERLSPCRILVPSKKREKVKKVKSEKVKSFDLPEFPQSTNQLFPFYTFSPFHFAPRFS
jgi:hypothetical protein